MTSKTHRQATDLFAATYILTSSATAADAVIIGILSSGRFRYKGFSFSGAATWPDDLEPDGTFGIREHHRFFKRRYIAFMRSHVRWLYKHRGWTHWLLTGVVIATFLGLLAAQLDPLFGRDVFRGILIGHWAHCLEDAATISGAPLFGPFIKRDFHLMPEGYRFNTNGPSDRNFRWAIIVLVLVVGYLALKNIESPGLDGSGLSNFLLLRD